jgi:hypothetical protein
MEKKSIVQRKSYTAMFKLEVVENTWKYIGVIRPYPSAKRRFKNKLISWTLESWQAVTVTCVKNKFQKSFGDTSTPEIEDHEESTSENELSDVPEEIINALYSFDCDSEEDFVDFEWTNCTVCVQWMVFCVSRFILVLWHEIPAKAELQKMKWNCKIVVSNYRNLFLRYTLL